MENIALFNRFYTFQVVVWDFFHQQYVSSPEGTNFYFGIAQKLFPNPRLSHQALMLSAAIVPGEKSPVRFRRWEDKAMGSPKQGRFLPVSLEMEMALQGFDSLKVLGEQFES